MREQTGGAPRALDPEFAEAKKNANSASGGGGQNNSNGNGSGSRATNASNGVGSTATTSSVGRGGKTYNRRTWTKEENEQLQQGISSLGIPETDLGKQVRTLQSGYQPRGSYRSYIDLRSAPGNFQRQHLPYNV